MDPPLKPIRNNLQEQLGLWRQDKKASLQQGFAPHTISRLADTGNAADKRWVALVLSRLLSLPRGVCPDGTAACHLRVICPLAGRAQTPSRSGLWSSLPRRLRSTTPK